MNKQILGFASIAQYVDNAPGQISVLGELSTWSRTFGKSKGEYSDPAFPGHRLITFVSSDTASGSTTELTSAEAALALEFSTECVNYAKSHPIPLDSNDFRDHMQVLFTDRIVNLEFGPLMEGAYITLPAWYDFTSKGADGDHYRVWMSDAVFAVEYPGYELTIIPPHDNLEIFAGNWQNAVNRLPEWPNIRLINEVQFKKNLHPETYIDVREYYFVNTSNPTQRVLTTWYTLVYGEAGNDEDSIKDAIIDKLVKETGHPPSFWEDIFPELFQRTEFIFYPRWDRLSIPNVSNLTALYSPFVDINDTTAYVREKATFIPGPHFEENIFSLPITYKSIAVNGVSGVNNAQGQTKLRDVWPDYIAVGTESVDFKRMQELTQDWVHFMIKLISSAETAVGVSTLPQGLRRRKRGDKIYISGSFNRINYSAYSRHNDSI